MRSVLLNRVGWRAVGLLSAACFGVCCSWIQPRVESHFAGSLAASADDEKSKVASEPALVGVRDKALSPTESAAQLVIDHDYQISLIANEPDVTSPVDAAFDDRGRLWVVEMIDYPFQKPGQAESRGRIRILTDSDKDGRYDNATVFADKLNMPTGLGLWRDGAVVTLGGQLVWMRDTDKDGSVDKQEIWLEGFAQENEQLRANHPRLEMDGRWYIASGLRGGKIQVGEALRGPNAPAAIVLGTRDVRLDPRTGLAEAITGPAQFGLTSDIAGSRLFCSNRNPCTQVVFEQSQLIANPLAGLIPPVHDALPAGEASRVSPLIEAWTTSNLHAGQFTAACGVHFQHRAANDEQSDELRKRLAHETLGYVYVCEPTGSLVHRQQVSHRGTLWSVDSASKQPDREWLASRDPWFRPVNIVQAPSHGLLVIDMHRAVIEHPAWVPDELKHRPDERFGEDAGRIYWVAEKSASWPSAVLKEVTENPLSTRSDAELVAALSSSDPWLQRTAARLLIERDGGDSLPALVELVSPQSHSSLETRVIAWQLISLFDPSARGHLQPALVDGHRLIQITALRMLSRLPVPAADGADDIIAEGTRMALDLASTTEDPWLRLEAAMCASRTSDALSDDDSRSAAAGMGKLAALHLDDPYLLIALAGAARKHSSNFLLSWLDGLGELDADDPLGQVDRDAVRDRWVSGAARLLVIDLHKNAPKAGAELIARVRFHLTSDEPLSNVSRLAALTALAQYARLTDHLHAQKPNVEATDLETRIQSIDRPLMRKVRELARLTDSPRAIRLAAIELLGQSTRSGDRELLKNLSTQSDDGVLRTAAIKAWAEQGSSECEEFMMAQLGQAGPGLRPTLLDLLLAKPDRHARVLAALSNGQLTAKQLGAVDLKRFVDRAKGDAKAGFQQQLDTILNSDRSAVLTNYQSCLELAGDLTRGQQVFVKHCAACHRVGDVGVQVGPDISDSRVHTAEKLLTSVLDPNRAIDNNYFRFVVLTTDGRTLDGLIAEETADKIVIRAQNDQRHVIARTDVEQLKPTGISMMPEGLESQIDQQSMADLIAFIKNWRYSSGQVPAGIKAGK